MQVYAGICRQGCKFREVSFDNDKHVQTCPHIEGTSAIFHNYYGMYVHPAKKF